MQQINFVLLSNFIFCLVCLVPPLFCAVYLNKLCGKLQFFFTYGKFCNRAAWIKILRFFTHQFRLNLSRVKANENRMWGEQYENFTLLQLRSQGGRGDTAPHWPEKSAKYPVFSTLRLIFALKTKIAPPPPQWYLRWDLVKNLIWYGPEKLGLSVDEDLFFGDHLILAEKQSQFRWRPFFFEITWTWA